MSSIHEVAQGECLASIAADYRFSDWRTIYSHPENAELRRKRQNPNLMCPGDMVNIPPLDLGEKPCATDRRHRFLLLNQRALLRIVIEDEKGNVFSGKKYRLEIEGEIFQGSTAGDGLLEEEIPVNAQSGVLTVWLNDDDYDDCTWELAIGSLDPVDEISGVQARLNNLNFICGPVDGIVGPRTRAAVQQFQTRIKASPTGIIDAALISKLREAYDKE